MCLEGAVFIGTNLDDEQGPFIIIYWVLHPSSGLNDLFWGPNYCKISLEKNPVCILFGVAPSCIVFDCVLGTLVAINNDEGNHLQPISTLLAALNASLVPQSGAARTCWGRVVGVPCGSKSGQQ